MRGRASVAYALAMVWLTVPLLAQEHGPSKPHGIPHGSAPASTTTPAKSAAHAKPDSHKPETKSAGHDSEGAAPPAAEHEASDTPAPPGRTPAPSNAATSTSRHADDEAVRGAERKARQPRPVAGRQLDAVMERINRRISSLSAEGGKRAVASTESAPPPATPSSGRSSPTTTQREARPTNEPSTTDATSVAEGTTEATAPPRVRLSWRPTVVWPASLQPDPTDGSVRLSWDTMVD